MKNDEKLKARESENIIFSLPVTAEHKKMNIDEIVVNKKGLVLELLMVDNPGCSFYFTVLDLSSLQENGSGDVVIDQATMDVPTNVSTDQMPIIDPLIQNTEDVSSSREAKDIPARHLSNLLLLTEDHSGPQSRILDMP
ncbi:hypothetical protein L1987_13418 [Smallanthus sonchifolius]|uniref:Uncharacterized protein n=1 Tax=Smallanthus sonchifolius TaxID=185202 RepID=A0ACB9JGU4_9ASTR|nr:hypothetical protein L1987_13418 [Smallanthus sonchifolius]